MTWFCPCGDRLWTKAELLAEDDDMARYVAEAYLDEDSAYCADEDDVVPREYWKEHKVGIPPMHRLP